MKSLFHYGIRGQKWGVRRFQYENGSYTPDGAKRYRKTNTLFVSGSSKTQIPESPYYRKELPKEIQNELDKSISRNEKIVVGDAPGIDRQVQDYLNKKEYNNVEIYGPGKEVRYSANSKWKTNPIDDPEHEPYSKEWLAKKDEFMTDVADKGLAVILDEGAAATRKNVQRLVEQNRDVKVFSLSKDGHDEWKTPEKISSEMKKIQYKEFDRLMTPEEVKASGKGSCHDQVILEMKMLRDAGYSPKAMFLMEHNSKGQGGMTHSFVYYEKNGKVMWLENAWKERAGIMAFNSVKDIQKAIKLAHKTGEFGDRSTFSQLSFGDFNENEQTSGESLQELVNHIKWL